MKIDKLLNQNVKFQCSLKLKDSEGLSRLSVDSGSLNLKNPSSSSVVYFIVVNGEIVKVGQSGSLDSALTWYIKLSKNMGKGRYIPHYFLEDSILEGKKVEFYVELLPNYYLDYPSILDISKNSRYLVSFAKEREKEYLNYIYEEDKSYPLLNRQEKKEGLDEFERKYTLRYQSLGGRVV